MMRTVIEEFVYSGQRFLTGIISTLFLGLERKGKPREIREDRDMPSDTVRWNFQQAGRLALASCYMRILYFSRSIRLLRHCYISNLHYLATGKRIDW